jgi:hypothetical protein
MGRNSLVTPELIGILDVGAALAGVKLVIESTAWMPAWIGSKPDWAELKSDSPK